MNSNYLLLLIGVAACFIQSVESIGCYFCDSTETKECGNDYLDHSKMKKVDCTRTTPPSYLPIVQNNPATGCMKITRLHKENGKDVESMLRRCYFGDLQNTTPGCTQDPQFPGIYIRCEICNTEYCNGSEQMIKLNGILIFSSILLLLKFFIL